MSVGLFSHVPADDRLRFLEESGDAFAEMELKCRNEIQTLLKTSQETALDPKGFSRQLIKECNSAIKSTIKAVSTNYCALIKDDSCSQSDSGDGQFFFSPGYSTLFGDQATRLEGDIGSDDTDLAREYHLRQGLGSMDGDDQHGMTGFCPFTCFMSELYEKNLGDRRVYGLTRWFSEFFATHPTETAKNSFLGLEILGDADTRQNEPADTAKPRLLRLQPTQTSPGTFLDEFADELSSKVAEFFVTEKSRAALTFPLVKQGETMVDDVELREAFAWLFWSIFNPFGRTQNDFSALETLIEKCRKKRKVELAQSLNAIMQFFRALSRQQISFSHYYVLVTQPGIPLEKHHGMFRAKSAVATINFYTQYSVPRSLLVILRRSVTAVYEFIRDIEIAVSMERLGRAEASHDFSYTVRTSLSDLRDLAEDVDSLRARPDLFPVKSFSELPSRLRSFTYPARLYAIALSSACKYERDDKNFLRRFPRVTWIKDALEKEGLAPPLIEQLAKLIARPLAKASLEQLDLDSSKIDRSCLKISGSISRDQIERFGQITAVLLVGVVSELLREAFQHSLEDRPELEVKLSEKPILQIIVANSCALDAAGVNASGGNQATTLATLMTRLPGWQLTDPLPENGVWTRILALKPA